MKLLSKATLIIAAAMISQCVSAQSSTELYVSAKVEEGGAQNVASEVGGRGGDESTAPLPANCWAEAGKRYGVDPWLLYSIAQQESSLRPLVVSPRNRNGSYDIGIMQINSRWLPELKRYGITEQHLYEPCLNINVGAWVLAHAMRSMGPNWKAVGAYNAGVRKSKQSDNLRAAYALRVYRRYRDNLRLHHPVIAER